jgi:TfoX/Sxy family transcriptional regulator of competence genes
MGSSGMAHDDDLADRIRAAIGKQDGVTERRMFGGLAFLVNGNMAVSASGQGGLLLRVDPGETDSVVREDGVSRFEMRGRQMDGWVRVDPSATASDQELARWVHVGVGYAASLPPK